MIMYRRLSCLSFFKKLCFHQSSKPYFSFIDEEEDFELSGESEEKDEERINFDAYDEVEGVYLIENICERTGSRFST